ncbi:MAG: hypothetical protein Q9160_008790 [Pyrenula sp. 1 TL-2023]
MAPIPPTMLRFPRMYAFLRPFRRPHKSSFNPARYFTSVSPLLLVAKSLPRPQLPFLHPLKQFPSNGKLASRLNRLMTTEAKAKWKARVRYGIKLNLIFWPFSVIYAIYCAGAHHEYLERKYPTPSEWSLWSRWFFRWGKGCEFEPKDRGDTLLVDWGKVGDKYKRVLERLEDPSIDGQDLIEASGEGILVDGVGRTGYDLSNKSEPWRRGYHQTLINLASAAEKLDGWVRDIKRDTCFPANAVIGPSNPRPVPQPHGRPEAPKEENCIPAFESPEVYYMKILTSRGFTSKQRLDAALSYADWLDFKGLTDTSRTMYAWALDIAVDGLPDGISGTVDKSTGVLNSDREVCITDNLLRASTALAVHAASKGDVATALPTLLSILKVRKSLPPGEDIPGPPPKDPMLQIWENFKSLFNPPPYPPAPPTGDEPARRFLKEICEEAGVMAYIGEILYASSYQGKGLSWTRDSVDTVEEALWTMVERNVEDGADRCQECLETGLTNWRLMIKNMARLAESKEREPIPDKRSWFSWAKGENTIPKNDWAQEERDLELRFNKVRPLLGGRILLSGFVSPVETLRAPAN